MSWQGVPGVPGGQRVNWMWEKQCAGEESAIWLSFILQWAEGSFYPMSDRARCPLGVTPTLSVVRVGYIGRKGPPVIRITIDSKYCTNKVTTEYHGKVIAILCYLLPGQSKAKKPRERHVSQVADCSFVCSGRTAAALFSRKRLTWYRSLIQ